MQSTIQLTAAQLILALVGATGFGSLLSLIFSLIAQAIERRARVKELLISKAIDMAHHRSDFLQAASKQTSEPMIIESSLVYAGELYQDLLHLFKKGKLPAEVQEAVDKYRKNLDV